MKASSNLFGYSKKRQRILKKRRGKTMIRPIVLEMTAAQALPEERAVFIYNTYLHLAGAIAAFVALEAVLLNSGIAQNIYDRLIDGWVSLLFFFISVLILILTGRSLVKSPNLLTQYLGFGLDILTDAIILAPWLFRIQTKAGGGIIEEAGIITIGLFLGITAVVFLTRRDFSFLSPYLIVGTFLVFGFLFAGLIFGFWVRSFFVLATIALTGGWILFNTSNILHRYRTDQYVAASLALFTSVVWLFRTILWAYSAASRTFNPNSESRDIK